MREPREAAVQALYELDLLGGDKLPGGLKGKALRLAGGVVSEMDEIDALLERASDHWAVDRMPAVDRAILRLGVYELRHEIDTPTPVVIAEAVRVAKMFSTEKSGKFVNGVLGTLAAQIRSRS